MKSYKDQIKDTFKQTKEVSCPAFGGNKIYFNAKGINHLLYKGSRSRRDNKRIETNIRLLPRAIKVLQAMPYFQEESNYKKEAVINDRRIKVVIRQVGNGQKHFWSVIPAWRKDRFGIINARKKNLEE